MNRYEKYIKKNPGAVPPSRVGARVLFKDVLPGEKFYLRRKGHIQDCLFSRVSPGIIRWEDDKPAYEYNKGTTTSHPEDEYVEIVS